MKIGFLGLGGMGQGMAANLVKAGHQVTVWNRSSGPAATLAAQGAQVAATPAEALQGDAALSILADDAATLSIFDDATLAQAAPGLVHGCMATISIDAVRALVARHEAAGLRYVGAPVFGRTEVAVAGKLNIIAAGAAADITRLHPAFDAMGQKTWVVGSDPTHAHTVKIAGNLMIATTIELLGETFALCEKSGVDPKTFSEVMTNTLFASPVFKTYAGIIADRAYEPPAFKLPLGLKDANLALAAGQATQTPLPLASLVRDHFLEALAQGGANKDWSALAEVSARKAGLRTS